MKVFSKATAVMRRTYKNLTFNEKLTLIFSLVAIFLSYASFHWTYLKDKSVLHLVSVDTLGLSLEPQFAIVNGGKSDILLTSLSCTFHYDDKTKSVSHPAQTIEGIESDSSLLPSGKAFHCKVKFIKNFTKSFVQKGELESTEGGELYKHDMHVNISWIEMDGTSFSKSVKFIRYGLNEKGEIRQKAPLTYGKPINLYKVKTMD